MTPDKSIRVRILVLGIAFSLMLLGITARAFHLQVLKRPFLSKKAADQYERSVRTTGFRGSIFDAGHREMAVSLEATSVAVNPKKIADLPSTAQKLARSLSMQQKAVLEKLTSDKPFVFIKRQITPREFSALKKENIDGIVFEKEHARYYPNKQLAGQLLGFSGTDGRGLEGLEFSYDTYLAGATNDFKIVTDAKGQMIDGEKPWTSDYRGFNIILTMDRRIQHFTEQALEKAVRDNQAKSGMAIVMAPKTGAVLALANHPSLNPNVFGDFDKQLWRNRAITDPFEPGSTLKIFSAAAALESGACTPHTIFFCENGAYRVGRNVVHDTHSYGWLSLQQIVKVSSNIGAVKIAENIGAKSLYDTLKKFGFGEKTGIDCPGETSGSLAPYKRWTRIDMGTIAFGQGVSVSAMQLIAAVSAIANDGVLMKPYAVQAISDHNGSIIKSFRPQEIRRALSANTARAIKDIMGTVVEEEGTGTEAALNGYQVCGKTGTAQKVGETGGYARGKYVSSFVGFVPKENPAIAILVVVDEPSKSNYGGLVAAPAFREIALQTLNYLNIVPGSSSERLTADLEVRCAGNANHPEGT